ncbi:MAG: hypothetical protein ACRDCW_02945 [Sarcina sp.]
MFKTIKRFFLRRKLEQLRKEIMDMQYMLEFESHTKISTDLHKGHIKRLRAYHKKIEEKINEL